MHAYPGRLFFQLFVERQFEPTTIEDQVSLLSRQRCHGLQKCSSSTFSKIILPGIVPCYGAESLRPSRTSHEPHVCPYSAICPDARRVYTMLTIIGVIVETIPGGEEWKKQTIGLLRTRSRAALDKMGVPDDWETEPLWNRP